MAERANHGVIGQKSEVGVVKAALRWSCFQAKFGPEGHFGGF